MQTILKHICLSVAAAAAFCACTDDDSLAGGADTGGGVSFVVSSIAPQTRVSHDGYIQSAMEVGDELGAFVIERTGDGSDAEYDIVSEYTENARYRVVADGISYTDTDGNEYSQALEPEVPTDTFPAGKRYVFYYPYKVGADITDFSHTVIADQSRETAFESSDFLRARVNATDDTDDMPSSVIETDATGRQILGVTMEHVMASVVLRVESSLVPDEADSREAKLLNVYRTVSGLDLTHALTSDAQTSAKYSDKDDIIMWNSGQETDDNGVTYEIFRAVLPAQTIEDGTEFLSFLFKGDSDDAKTYTLDLGDLTLEPGKYYLFTLTDANGTAQTSLSAVSIKDWNDGGLTGVE